MWSYMAINNPTSPAQYVIILLDLARQQGVSAADILADTSLDPASLSTIGARVNEDDFHHIINKTYLLTGDRALGLHLGSRLNLSAHATVGQAFMTCENLEQVLNFFLKYYHILAPALDIDYTQHDGRCWLIPDNRQDDLPLEFGYELLFAALHHNIKLLVNNPDMVFRVELPYPEPDYVSEYRAVLGDDLHFNAGVGSISLSDEWLDSPLPSSNPALLELYEQECQRLLADLEEQDSLSEQTTQLLRKLEGHYPQMPQVADILNMSPRTYRRKLSSEGASFQQLLDDVRTEHATHYLKTTQLPLASIAYIIGFNDVSNFRRAYINWTGMTPREARNHH